MCSSIQSLALFMYCVFCLSLVVVNLFRVSLNYCINILFVSCAVFLMNMSLCLFYLQIVFFFIVQ